MGSVSLLRALRRVHRPIVFHLESYWWQYINSPETRFSRVRASRVKKAVIGRVPPLRFSSCIAASAALKEEYVRAGCPGDRIEVIDNALDPALTSDVQRPPRDSEPPVLMYAGRLCVEKGVEVALDAVDRLVNQERRAIRVRIYGTGEAGYVARLHDSVRRRRLQEVVTFAGRVDREQVVSAYDSADVLLVPSIWEEPFGLVAVEGMARGLAVVASSVGGLSSVIRDGVDGYLVPPEDAAALASTAGSLLDDPSARQRIGQTARRAVTERFAIEGCVEKIESHLERARHLGVQGARYPR